MQYLKQKENGKTSFLESIAPEPYDFLRNLKTIALIYAVILVIFFVLSLHFYNAFIKYFINIMMGWTIMSVIFTVVLIVILDKNVSIKKDDECKTPLRYRLSMVWGITLCLIGITYLFISNSYKHDYAFYCQVFYLEDTSNVFHIRKDCKYIGENTDGDPLNNVHVSEIKGYELRGDEYSLCVACKEWIEDAEIEYGSSKFCRR